MKPTIDEKTDFLIADMYKNGTSAYKIADALDLTHTIVYKSLQRTNTRRRHKGKATRKYNFDTHAFDIIDSEEKAYWWGFLYADSCMNKTSLRLVLNIEDREHIEKINNFLESEYPIEEYKRYDKVYDKDYSKARVIITEKDFSNRLRELGISAGRKHFDLSELPKELYHHWMRGYFDANGCVTGRKSKSGKFSARINFSAPNKDIIIWIKQQLMQFSNKPDKKVQKVKNKKAYCIDYGGRNICEKIYNYMYKDATIFLDRKKKKFMEYY